jgi:predicted secreted protein
MKLIGAAFAISAMCAAGVVAQTQTTHQEDTKKIEIKDGKKVTVTGCLETNPVGGYMLTDERGDMEYALVTDKDLSKHVGERVAVRGKATDRGDARVKMESKVGTTGTTSDSKAELKGDLDLRMLGVDSVKRLAKSCR